MLNLATFLFFNICFFFLYFDEFFWQTNTGEGLNKICDSGDIEGNIR